MSTDDLSVRFEAAVMAAKQLRNRPANDILLKLYAYYKQATVGDVEGRRPGFTDFAGRAKYDAWKKVKGLAAEDAMQHYIDLVEALKRGK
ncbi:MAG: acyl-CoA-binding protein [Clostridia bacterium]|nr:MAG: acyl-CoA-binding protein [Clostridia bacterium]